MIDIYKCHHIHESSFIGCDLPAKRWFMYAGYDGKKGFVHFCGPHANQLILTGLEEVSREEVESVLICTEILQS